MANGTPYTEHHQQQNGGTGAVAPILPARATAAACDGACKKTGHGGWGYVVELASGRRLQGSGAEADTTNNRQELRAAIEALQALAPLAHTGPLELATDSRYVLHGLTRWLAGWKRNGWRTAEGGAVLNRDLWEQLEAAAAAAPWVQLVWVKGHNGHPLNEAADKLASAAAEQLRSNTHNAPAPVGSSWDLGASPDRVIPDHLSEWVTGSAIAPELAAANLQSLAGRDVLEALAGERIEQLGGWATQYATGKVARLLRPLEPIAEGGGWWVAGLDPLADWAPMAWGQFKPNRPRWNPEKAKPIKYEAPIGQPTRSAWLRVPAVVARRVADRFGLQLPDAVAADLNGDAGAFWRWLASEHRLPLVITEGAKKAGALLSAGVPAVALPGVDNGAKRTGPVDPNTGRRTGPVELIPDLAGLSWTDRRAWVLFDWSDKADGRR